MKTEEVEQFSWFGVVCGLAGLGLLILHACQTSVPDALSPMLAAPPAAAAAFPDEVNTSPPVEAHGTCPAGVCKSLDHDVSLSNAPVARSADWRQYVRNILSYVRGTFSRPVGTLK